MTQATIPLSSAEAEAEALTNVCVEGTDAKDLLEEPADETHNLSCGQTARVREQSHNDSKTSATSWRTDNVGRTNVKQNILNVHKNRGHENEAEVLPKSATGSL